MTKKFLKAKFDCIRFSKAIFHGINFDSETGLATIKEDNLRENVLLYIRAKD